MVFYRVLMEDTNNGEKDGMKVWRNRKFKCPTNCHHNSCTDQPRF